MKTLFALAIAAVVGITAGWHLTDGFRVFTTEDARRLRIAEHPMALPDATLEQEDGQTVSLANSLQADGRATIIVFFYVRCNAVCSVLGSQSQQLQDAIRARGLSKRVRLLALSFDSRDDRLALAEYAKRMGADRDVWRMARFTDEEEKHRLLAASGITVVPAPLGEYQHNAAFHIVSTDGRLTRIVDYDRVEEALAHAQAVSTQTTQRNGVAL